MLLQEKGEFTLKPSSDFISTTTNVEVSVNWEFVIALVLLIGIIIYFKRRKKS